MARVTLAVRPDGTVHNPLTPLPGAQAWLAVLYRKLTRYPQRHTIATVDQLAPGDPIEFGADILPRLTADGLTTFRQPRRWCGVVLEVKPDALVVQPCHDDYGALHAAYLWRQRHQPRPLEWWEQDDADPADQAEPA